MAWIRPAPPVALAGEERTARLARFRAAHPDVVFLLLGSRPRAWPPWAREPVEGQTLCELLNRLERMYARSG